MKELMGGLWLAGLLIWASLGLLPGLILLGLGAAAGVAVLYKEYKEEAAAQNWRRNYPSYKY